PHASSSVLGCRDHIGMLTHAEVIVRAPDRNLARLTLGTPDRLRETTHNTFKIGKYTIAALVMELCDRFLKKSLVIHLAYQRMRPEYSTAKALRPRTVYGQIATPD